MIASRLYTEFFNSEKSGGLVLILFTIISLLLVNTTVGPAYAHFWHLDVAGKPLEFWINDGLMTIFFLLVGLEIEREIYVGEFSDIKNALLPILAALGGMAVPAGIHFLFNHGTSYQQGIGIPMATDIAFALGILSLLGKRVPVWLKVFLTASAIMDDLGAIIIIAIFYSKEIDWSFLGLALLAVVVMLTMRRSGIRRLTPYLLFGTGLWFCLYKGGIHPTIAGILLAFCIPFGKGDQDSVSYKLQHVLHKPVAFIVLPIFALANTVIPITAHSFDQLWHANSYGIFFGLVFGKPLGMMVFVLIGLWLGWCSIPKGIRKRYILGTGMLAGIGFTMSIFITLLAFDQVSDINISKLVVLIASITSGVAGFITLSIVLPKRAIGEVPAQDS